MDDLKIAPKGRCGHLSDRGDKDFCDGGTAEHVQMTSAKKKIEILTAPLLLKHPASNDCAD